MSNSSKSAQANPAYVFEPAGLVARVLRGKVKGLGLPSPQEEAEAALQAAHSEAESIRQAAYSEGFEAGMQEGASQWQRAMANLVQERETLQEGYEQHVSSVEPEVVELSLDIAQKIVAHEIAETPETVISVLRLALKQLRAREGVRIWVNQADLELVRSAREDIADWVEGLREVEIEEDRRVGRGGVMIESSDGILDARPSSQIQEITRRLQEAA
ncbi:MAG: FliH/SctL family protein [Armatimonadota bacterium]